PGGHTPPKKQVRKSKKSADETAPEQLKSAGQLVYVASSLVTLPQVLETMQRTWKRWGKTGSAAGQGRMLRVAVGELSGADAKAEPAPPHGHGKGAGTVSKGRHSPLGT